MTQAGNFPGFFASSSIGNYLNRSCSGTGAGRQWHNVSLTRGDGINGWTKMMDGQRSTVDKHWVSRGRCNWMDSWGVWSGLGHSCNLSSPWVRLNEVGQNFDSTRKGWKAWDGVQRCKDYRSICWDDGSNGDRSEEYASGERVSQWATSGTVHQDSKAGRGKYFSFSGIDYQRLFQGNLNRWDVIWTNWEDGIGQLKCSLVVLK